MGRQASALDVGLGGTVWLVGFGLEACFVCPLCRALVCSFVGLYVCLLWFFRFWPINKILDGKEKKIPFIDVLLLLYLV